jgi:SSS family solute:Na+ symporter
VVLGWDPLVSAIVLVFATGIYTIAGGLAAVIYVDMIQAFILISGACVLTLLGLHEIGGFSGLRAALPPEFFHMIKPASDPVYPWPGTTLGVVILGIWYWCTDQVIVQRTLGARNLTHSRGATIFASFLKLFPLFILILPGLIARVLWPAEVSATPDMAFPLIVTKLMPVGLAGLMIAALLAALMGSMSSVFNSCSTLITMDVYRRINPNASERRLVTVGRLATLGVVILSILWIPMIRLLSNQVYQYLQSVQAYIGAPITAVFLTGILWKRATGKAAITTLIVGASLGAARFIVDIVSKACTIDFGSFSIITGCAFLNYSIGLFFFCVALMIIISLNTPAPDQKKIENLTFSPRTMSAGVDRTWVLVHVGLSILVLTLTISIWSHFA